MSTRVALVVVTILSATFAFAQDRAPVTFSGTGKGPVEVKDSSGEVTEVITQRSLTLNQIPAEAAAREQAYREQQNARARELEAERAEEQSALEAAEAEAAKAAEEAAAEAAAQARAEEEEFDHTPQKVRRKTVRGTRYVATEPVDPSLRTPENSGIKQVWPPPRPEQELPKFDEKLPTYNPDPD